MPYSPFARFLAAVIIALFAMALLWPDDRAQLWGAYSLAALPLIVGVFTWNVVRSAAPYDDRAFHRCLPPGPGHVFLRTVWIHLLVLAGIALAVLIYCWLLNFSWRAMSYGIVLLTLPLWAFISAIGLASALAATNQHWRSSAWVAILATPLFSWALLYWARTGIAPEEARDVYFTPVRTIALTAGTLYPLIWWLAAVPRRRPLGMLFGAATGALLPWLYVYGDFVKAPGPQEEYESRNAHRDKNSSPVKLTRKPVPDSSGNWIPVSDLIGVDGLEDGESVALNVFAHWGGENEREPLLSFEVRDENDLDHGGVRYVEVLAHRSGGKLLWGDDAIWQSIRSQLPPHQHFEYWQTYLNRPTPPPAILRAGASILRNQNANEERRAIEYRKLTPELFRTSSWSAWVSAPMRWSLLGSCETKHSARFKLSGGGAIKLMPLAEQADGHHLIQLQFHKEKLWGDGGPWFGQERDDYDTGWLDLRLVIVDESGKQAFAVDHLAYRGGTSNKVLLGRTSSFYFDAGAADSPEQIKRIEMLRHARIYVFTSNANGRFPTQMELPP